MQNRLQNDTPTPTGTIEVFRGIIYNESSETVLYVKRSRSDSYHPGLFEFPGGKVDPDEAGIDALRREVKEETGLVIEPITDSLESSEIYVDQSVIEKGKYGGMLYISRFIVSRIVAGDVNLSNEHEDFCWNHISTAPVHGPLTDLSSNALKKLQLVWALSNS